MNERHVPTVDTSDAAASAEGPVKMRQTDLKGEGRSKLRVESVARLWVHRMDG